MTALLAELVATVAAEGPMPLSRYMALALGHPVHGYYMTRDPFGEAGDFTTAPEISQMFGELLGLWAGAVWDRMGRPDGVALVELGPGRGTLMADALRAARVVPGFLAALSVHLVETSPVLRERQRATLAGAGAKLHWHAHLREVPPGPLIVLANEFLDALPVDQWVRTRTGWHERTVGLGPDGALAFGLAPEPEFRLADLSGRPGQVLEVGTAAAQLVRSLAERLVQSGGAALFVDYGYTGPPSGPTLQAVRRHRPADPLAEPGLADLTAHVDFDALARAAASAGARLHGPTPQADFLEALGIGARASRLKEKAAPEARQAIDAALVRLTGRREGEMGALFKAVGLSSPEIASLPGLPAAPPAAPPGASARAGPDLGGVAPARPAC